MHSLSSSFSTCMRDVDRYMEVIDALSKGLPPTVMVHGVEEVVTYSINAV